MIRYWNRKTQQWEEEKVYGGVGVRLLYQTPWGRRFLPWVRTPFWSWLCGVYQSTRWSARQISHFIRDFQIPMEEFEAIPKYASFNEFFIRRFRSGQRSFVQEAHLLAAFCEARYFAWAQTQEDDSFLIKGIQWNISKLLGGDSKWLKVFRGGPLLLARLCPVDYHRFHFPVKGEVVDRWKMAGGYDSVNPLAFAVRPGLLFENERRVTILKTEAFGFLAYVEVGALCVGKIVDTHQGASFERGEEKGYFLFGASTVLLLGEPKRWVPASDLLEKTQQGHEVWVPLGEAVGSLLAPARGKP